LHAHTIANGPPSAKFAPPWLKPLVTPLTVGGTILSTRPGAVVRHVGALYSTVAHWLGCCLFQLNEHEDALNNFKEAIERRQQSSTEPKTDSILASFHQNAAICFYKLERCFYKLERTSPRVLAMRSITLTLLLQQTGWVTVFSN